jgi:hypothetical protein
MTTRYSCSLIGGAYRRRRILSSVSPDARLSRTTETSTRLPQLVAHERDKYAEAIEALRTAASRAAGEP